jgi:hypothetical protein
VTTEKTTVTESMATPPCYPHSQVMKRDCVTGATGFIIRSPPSSSRPPDAILTSPLKTGPSRI